MTTRDVQMSQQCVGRGLTSPPKMEKRNLLAVVHLKELGFDQQIARTRKGDSHICDKFDIVTPDKEHKCKLYFKYLRFLNCICHRTSRIFKEAFNESSIQ